GRARENERGRAAEAERYLNPDRADISGTTRKAFAEGSDRLDQPGVADRIAGVDKGANDRRRRRHKAQADVEVILSELGTVALRARYRVPHDHVEVAAVAGERQDGCLRFWRPDRYGPHALAGRAQRGRDQAAHRQAGSSRQADHKAPPRSPPAAAVGSAR